VLGSNEGVMLVAGTAVVPVPAGTYTLVFNRGPEYEIVEAPVTVAAGESKTITAQLDHTVDTRGWISSDLHVHTARSFDAKLALERRVISMVTNHVELIVPTDHNIATDLTPAIAALGYGTDVVGQVTGDEFNFGEGHGGAFPHPYDGSKVGGGALPYQNLNPQTGKCDAPVVGINCYTAAQAFPIMRDQIPGRTMVAVNHPWYPPGNDLGYFTNIPWGAGTPTGLPAPMPTIGLFDAIEVVGGYWTRPDVLGFLTADWFYILGQGFKVTALGSSDTHRINWVRAGWPRTWFRMPVDRPGEVTPAMLSDAVKNQRAIASTGPFVLITADGAQIGDTVVPKTAGKVAVSITADGPAWIVVDEVRLYVNGKLHRTFQVPLAQRPQFRANFDLDVTTDSWLVVLATGKKPLPADIVGEYSISNGWEVLPYALTNPIYVDADGNGQWQPPAAPVPPRGGLRLPRPRPADGRLHVPVDCDPAGPKLEPIAPATRVIMPLLDF
jgi:hypothetical protein